MKKTKIICTMGPACSDEETLTKMVRAGMNVARFNFSHGTHEEHAGRMALVRKVREKLNAPIALMLDTKGPEYRIKTFREHKVTLNDGQARKNCLLLVIKGNMSQVWQLNLTANLQQEDTHANSRSESSSRR